MKYTSETQARLRVVLAILILLAMVPTADVAAAFRFVVVGDRTGGHVEGVYGEILDEVQRLRPDFVITVGDMIEGYTEDSTRLNSEWKEYLGLVDGLSMPIYYTPGNHDITNEVMRPFYLRYVGEPYYSFDYGDCHFVVIDNAPGGGGPAEPLPEEQWNWLVNDLADHADAAFTFAFCHKPFWYENRFEGKSDSLHDLLVQYGVDAVFTGHYHRYFTAELDGILYTGVGSSGGGARSTFEYLQYHFMWVTVDEQGIAISPIDKSSVQPWDYVTAENMRLTDRIQQLAVAISDAIPVVDDLDISAAGLSVDIRNLSDKYPVLDTLRWEVPSGWSVRPSSLAVSLEPGEEQQLTFDISGSGDLYPVPTLTLAFPIADDKSVIVQHDLQVARQVTCFGAASPPVIDGDLSEALWHDPTTRLFGPDGTAMEIDSVQFYFAHDESNLYLGALCHESMIDSLRAGVTERDGAVYGEDCVGYFFHPVEGSDTVYQVYINPLGAVFDQMIVWDDDGHYDADRDWNGDFEIKTVRADSFWSMEVRIPFAQLGAAGQQGETWRINFRRKQKRFDSSADWQAPIDYDPATFGHLSIE